MPFGLLTGLGAALAWGTLDIVTALTSRVIGSLRVTAGMQLVTAVLFAILFIVTGATLPDDPGHDRDLDPPGLHRRRGVPRLLHGPPVRPDLGRQRRRRRVRRPDRRAVGRLSRRVADDAPGRRRRDRDDGRRPDRPRLRWRLALDPVRRSRGHLLDRRADPLRADDDGDRHRPRIDRLGPGLYRRAHRERGDRHRDGHRALDRRDALRPPSDGRPGLVEPRASPPPSSAPASSTSSASSRSPSASNRRRRGWSVSPRRSDRR